MNADEAWERFAQKYWGGHADVMNHANTRPIRELRTGFKAGYRAAMADVVEREKKRERWRRFASSPEWRAEQ